MKNNWVVALLIASSLTLFTSVASAGGPLIVDPNTQKAYTFGPGTVPVYYDLGNFGTVVDYSTDPPTTVVFDNNFGKKLVETGIASWSNIATSSFRGSVIGDFSQIGLPNIDSTNVTDIIGGQEREGVFVIFDEDGSIMENFFGVSPAVLGISSPQYAIEGTTTITMSWTVLSGQAIDPQDTTGQYIQGVATHEFGHSLGMAHTQTNGAAYFFQDNVGPDSCSNLPYNTGLDQRRYRDDVSLYQSGGRWHGNGPGQHSYPRYDRRFLRSLSRTGLAKRLWNDHRQDPWPRRQAVDWRERDCA